MEGLCLVPSDGWFNRISLFDCRFFSTSVNKEQLGELARQLDVKHKHIYIQMGIEIYDVGQCKKANLSRRYPEHAGEYLVKLINLYFVRS